MSPANPARTKTDQSTGERSIVIERTFDAPRAVVFEAWTDPKQLAQWWDPSGAPLAVCEMDVRPKGKFRWVNSGPGGASHPFTGTYVEVTPPERLVFTTGAPSGASSTGTLVFTEKGGRTTLNLTMSFASQADRDAMVRMRVDAGTRQTLENLAGFLRKTAK